MGKSVETTLLERRCIRKYRPQPISEGDLELRRS